MVMFNVSNFILVQPWTLIVAAVAFLLSYLYLRPKRNVPPGPLSLPIIGTMLSHKLVWMPEELCELADKYGEIYKLTVLSNDIIVVNSYEAIKEATITKSLDFTGRGVGHSFTCSYLNPSMGGMATRDFDEQTQTLRSTALSIMRNLGVGRSTMEHIISHEAEQVVNIFAANDCKAFNPWHTTTAGVVNIIMHILVKKRHDYNDEELQCLIESIDTWIQKFRLFPIFDRFPALRFVPGFKGNFDTLVNRNTAIINYIRRHIKPLVSSFHPGQDSHFVDAFLDKNYDVANGKLLTDEYEVTYLVRDLLIAGIETTTTSLKWTLLYLANMPHIQEKLQTQLDRIVGRDRPYCLADRVPYLDAVIWEVQRHCTIVPTGVPHAVSTPSNARLCGYEISKHALILFNLFAVHNDKTVWGDPRNFRPERYLDTNGDFVKHHHVIPFGIGKRSCIGELLARQQLYIFTAILFQRFNFLPPDGIEQIDPTPELAFTCMPKPFQIKAIPRY